MSQENTPQEQSPSTETINPVEYQSVFERSAPIIEYTPPLETFPVFTDGNGQHLAPSNGAVEKNGHAEITMPALFDNKQDASSAALKALDEARHELDETQRLLELATKELPLKQEAVRSLTEKAAKAHVVALLEKDMPNLRTKDIEFSNTADVDAEGEQKRVTIYIRQQEYPRQDRLNVLAAAFSESMNVGSTAKGFAPISKPAKFHPDNGSGISVRLVGSMADIAAISPEKFQQSVRSQTEIPQTGI